MLNCVMETMRDQRPLIANSTPITTPPHRTTGAAFSLQLIFLPCRETLFSDSDCDCDC